MKKALIIIITLSLISIIFMISTAIFNYKYKEKLENEIIAVYILEGVSDNFKLSNEYLIISNSKEKLVGGEIVYIGEKIENIIYYEFSISVNNHILWTGSVSIKDKTNGVSFPEELESNKTLGGISGDLLNETNFKKNNDNTYLNIIYSLQDGTVIKEQVKLKAREVDFNMN